jgi:hypothetical protein
MRYTVHIRKRRLEVDNAAGPSPRPLSPAGARCLAHALLMPDLLLALLPLLQDLDPALATVCVRATPAERQALARDLDDRADQLRVAEWHPEDRMDLTTPVPVDGTDGGWTVREDDGDA